MVLFHAAIRSQLFVDVKIQGLGGMSSILFGRPYIGGDHIFPSFETCAVGCKQKQPDTLRSSVLKLLHIPAPFCFMLVRRVFHVQPRAAIFDSCGSSPGGQCASGGGVLVRCPAIDERSRQKRRSRRRRRRLTSKPRGSRRVACERHRTTRRQDEEADAWRVVWGGGGRRLERRRGE